MLQRTSAAHLLPRLVKAVEGGTVTTRTQWSKCTRNAFRCSSNVVNLLPRVTTAPDLWRQHRTLPQGHHHYHYHHHHHHPPFTIAKMYSSNVLQATHHTTPTSVSLLMLPSPSLKDCHIRLYSSKPPSVPSSSLDENQNETKTSPVDGKLKKGEVSEATKAEEKMSIVQKFKLMYKQYWYVLIPVHIVTSIVWYGSFFIAAKSGVDIIPLMEKLGAGEKILSHLQSSNAGYYAIAYAMYKIATPARYTVTVGGTTISINYLKKRGYIKPVPSSEQLKEMYEGKKEEFIERKEELVEKYQERKEEMVDRYQEKKEEFIDRYQERREEIKGRYQERREEIKGRYQERREEMVQRLSERRNELKGKVAEKKEEFKDRFEERKDQLAKARESRKKR